MLFIELTNDQIHLQVKTQWKDPCLHFLLFSRSAVSSSWTVAHQAFLSMGFPRQNTGVDCHFLLQGISSTQTLNQHPLHWQADSLLSDILLNARNTVMKLRICLIEAYILGRKCWVKNFSIVHESSSEEERLQPCQLGVTGKQNLLTQAL